MPEAKLLRLAKRWRPQPDDPLGSVKRGLIECLIEQGASCEAPVPINRLRGLLGLENTFSREAFQHQLLGPLRRERTLFIGTGSKGVYLVTSPRDADETLGFYTWRIRAEQRHARNLRALARRTKLFEGYTATPRKGKDRAIIYADESGTPDVNNPSERFFVVAAVVIESRKELSTIERRFKQAHEEIRRPLDQEMRAAALSSDKLRRVLKELSVLDYSWAAACFDMNKLKSGGFRDPKTLYRYAFQFLVGELLQAAWQADLVLDENSTPQFQAELEHYLRRNNSGMPVSRLGEVAFAQSAKSRLTQLADLVAGAVRHAARRDSAPLDEIVHQMIDLHHWPAR